RTSSSAVSGNAALARPAKYFGPVNAGRAVAVDGVSDAHFREAGAHQVGAMLGAGDPVLHHLFGRRLARGDVFPDAAPGVAGAADAVGGTGSVAAFVFQIAV